MSDFTHFTDDGRPQMVNVGEKDETRRVAVAGGRVNMSQDTLKTVKSGGLKKGDVLSVAQLAGIMGCLLYTSPSPRDAYVSRMPSSA